MAYLRRKNSKNKKPYALPLEGELWEITQRRLSDRDQLTDKGVITHELVFHRKNGGPLYNRNGADFDKAWDRACKNAGIGKKLFHDLSRTACRNLRKSGVPESVAMDIVGRSTPEIFRRYDIKNDDDKKQAQRKLQAYVENLPRENKPEHGQNTDN